MEKRVLLAVLLSFIVLYGYQALFVGPARSPQPAATRTADSETEAQAVAPPAEAALSAAAGSKELPAPPASPEAALAAGGVQPDPVQSVVADDSERPVVVESDLIRAEFSNRGAHLTSWTLKQYHDTDGQPVRLTAPAAVKGLPPAFAISVDDAPLTRTLDTALFRPSVTELRLSGDPERDRVVFEYQDSSGLTARKEFAFGSNGRGYVVTVTASVRRGGDELAPRIHSGPGLGDVTDVPQSSSFLVPSYRQPTEGILFRDGEVERHPPSALATESRFEGTFGYIGIDDHYFIQVLLPGDRPLAVQYVTADAGGGTSYVGYVSEFDRGPASATYFFGPKKFEVLSGIDTELVRAINFGMFDVIVVPLLRALNWVNGYVGNYGWSIIILTILINAAMFPLRHKSVVSMRKMQQLQPQAQAIQKRYANLKVTDPARQKMNSELMELYRQHKVNPASGCVPMLLTLPVLFAFYSMLSQAIELRGAPFVGWITDLSTYDPSFITPLLMGATMVWQQKIQPSTADPVQQKVMMFMPIMFTFMFLWAPSGLVLYWLISNVWAIGQQYLTNAITGAPAGVPAKPARAGQ